MTGASKSRTNNTARTEARLPSLANARAPARTLNSSTCGSGQTALDLTCLRQVRKCAGRYGQCRAYSETLS